MNNNNAIIFQALDVILDKREQQLEYNRIDNTIITEIINPTNGLYSIEFNGNKIPATAISSNELYAIGDSVVISYVNNRLEDTTQILKKLENTDEKNTVSYVPFGPDWFPKFFTLMTDQMVKQNTQNAEIFKNYVNSCNYIRLSAEFKPTLLKAATEYKFRYGIQIIFELEDKTTAEYFLDSNHFSGNIYANSCKKQEIVLNVPNNIKTLLQVKAYIVDPEDGIGKLEVDKGEQIAITNCNIVFLKQVEKKNNLYYLDIRAPEGVYFTKEIENDLTLEASLICGAAQSVVSDDNLTFSWYRQKGYDWLQIPDETSSILTITNKDVQVCNIFKVVVQLNNGISLEKEIEIFNYNNDLEFKLELQDSILKINNENYQGKWQIEYVDSKEQATTEVFNALDISDYIGYDWVKFYCYDLSNGDEEILDVTLSYLLAAAEKDTDLSEICVVNPLTYTDISGILITIQI